MQFVYMIYVLYGLYDLLRPWYQDHILAGAHSARSCLMWWPCVNICHFGRENGGDSAIWRILPLALLLLCRLVILWAILSNFCLMFLARKGKKGSEIWQSLAERPAKYRHRKSAWLLSAGCLCFCRHALIQKRQCAHGPRPPSSSARSNSWAQPQGFNIHHEHEH